jgi:hypothetical protein
MSEQEERQRSVTTNVPLGQNSQKGTERLLPSVTHEHGDDLSRLESTATEAELQHLAAAEAMAGGTDPRDTLSAMAKFDFGSDGHLTVETLAIALTEMRNQVQTVTTGDAIFGGFPPTLSSTTQISVPAMRKADGKYRANQLSVLAANTPAAFYQMLLKRRDECWRALSDGYLTSRIFFMKLWIFWLVEGLGKSPFRPWTHEYDEVEDSIMEGFVVFCSNRFVTWGSVTAAKTHVVEFMRSMWGQVPPPFHKADYTIRKFRKLMATERPTGRRTRTGFTVEEVRVMFTSALRWLDEEDNPDERRLYINLIAACGLMYEKGYRGGNVIRARWNKRRDLSRHTIRGMLRTKDELQTMVEDGAVAILFNPPATKNSTHTSEVARESTTKPTVIDITATEPYSMATLAPMLHEIDGMYNDAQSTPAFRDNKGRCITPNNARRFTLAMAKEAGVDVKRRGTGLHSYRITRMAAWDKGMQSAEFAREIAQVDPNILHRLSGHTSESGAAPYNRDELAAILAADRAAATAVLAPIETLFRFENDRSQGQSIVVRQNSDGTYTAVDDPDDLTNHYASSSESESEEEPDGNSQEAEEDEDDEVQATQMDTGQPGPQTARHPGDESARLLFGRQYAALSSLQKDVVRDHTMQMDDDRARQKAVDRFEREEDDRRRKHHRSDLSDPESAMEDEGSGWAAAAQALQAGIDRMAPLSGLHGPGPGLVPDLLSQGSTQNAAAEWQSETTNIFDRAREQQSPMEIKKFAMAKWKPVVSELIQRRASAEGREPISTSQRHRYVTEKVLVNSLIAIGAPTALDIVQRHSVGEVFNWSADRAAHVHANLKAAKEASSALDPYVNGIYGALMHCDATLLSQHVGLNEQPTGGARTSSSTTLRMGHDQYPSRLQRREEESMIDIGRENAA